MDTKAAFEKWFDENMYLAGQCFCTESEKRRMLKTWTASRAAIEIELPEKISQFNMHNGRSLPEAASYDEAIDDCAEAITSHGIRIKGSKS